jgi:hypothetical protein
VFIDLCRGKAPIDDYYYNAYSTKLPFKSSSIKHCGEIMISERPSRAIMFRGGSVKGLSVKPVGLGGDSQGFRRIFNGHYTRSP